MERENDSNIVTSEVDSIEKNLPSEKVSEEKLTESNPEQFTEQDKQDAAKFLSDPANISKATQMAFELIEVVGKNWFTLQRLCSKTKLTQQSAFMKLSLLNQFGLLVYKAEKIKIGKYWGKVTMYKVTVSNEAKIVELRNAIEYYKTEISKLEDQIATLERKSPAQN